VPLPFRRKSSQTTADADAASESADVRSATSDASEGSSDSSTTKARTPSKRERGIATPKRGSTRRVVEPPPANRREAYRRLREKDRAERAEKRRGMQEGDPRMMLKRDQGPERALVRDIVDHRMTVGTWFFAGAFVVVVGGSAAMPLSVRIGANILWIMLAAAMVVDSYLIARRIKKLVRQRFPKTDQRLGSLYFYGIMRGITFRRMRMPRPRIKLGEDY